MPFGIWIRYVLSGTCHPVRAIRYGYPVRGIRYESCGSGIRYVLSGTCHPARAIRYGYPVHGVRHWHRVLVSGMRHPVRGVRYGIRYGIIASDMSPVWTKEKSGIQSGKWTETVWTGQEFGLELYGMIPVQCGIETVWTGIVGQVLDSVEWNGTG